MLLLNMPKLHHKLTQFLIAFFKVVVVICVCVFIYERLFNETNFKSENLLQFFSSTTIFTFKTIFVLLCLTTLNWVFEIKKWQILVTPFYKLIFFESVKQSLSAHVLAIITPLRAGEYGVKAGYFPKHLRITILKQNAFGHFVQLSITVILGVLGCYIITINLYHDLLLELVFGFALLGIVLFSIAQKLMKKLMPNINLTASVAKFSMLRYIVFAHQFYTILVLCDVQLGYTLTMSLIAATYLIASVIPILNLFDVALKGSVAITLFSLFGAPAISVFCATLLMWVFNFVLPAILGSVFFIRSTFYYNSQTSKALQDA
jgi:hypothetical protein